MTTAYASYERTAIVETYSYSATLVSKQGETTATLTARQDLDCPRRREIACPGNCKCWYTLHYNTNLQQYEPVHCNNCCFGLYDIHVEQPVPAETSEPATQAVAEPGPVEEPAPIKPLKPEQKAYFVKFVMNSDQSKKYAMLFRKSDGLAVGCECKSRKFHRGVACKHMTAHNNMLKTASQQEAA